MYTSATYVSNLSIVDLIQFDTVAMKMISFSLMDLGSGCLTFNSFNAVNALRRTMLSVCIFQMARKNYYYRIYSTTKNEMVD